MERVDYIRFYHLMEVLPTYWPDWEKHFANMDVDIPGRTEKADFYIYCINQCKDVNEARHVEQDMVAGQDVDACKKAIKKIFDEMEKPVLKYCEENRIPVVSREQDPTGDFFTGYTGKDVTEDGENEAFVEKKDNGIYTQEQAEQRYEVLINKYHEGKLAKEMAKSGAEEDKSDKTIPADAEDNNIISEPEEVGQEREVLAEEIRREDEEAEEDISIETIPADAGDNNTIINENPKQMPHEEFDNMPTQEEVNEWYDSLIQVLNSRGIETDSPLALGVVRVIPKEEDIDPDRYFLNSEPENVGEEIREIMNCYEPAFLERDEDGSVKNPFEDCRDYVSYLTKNIKTQPSDEHKRFLWQMAHEGRLALQNADPTFSPGYDYMIWNKPDGSAMVMDLESFYSPYGEFDDLIKKAPAEQKEEIQKRKEAWLSERGMTDEQAKKLCETFAPLDAIYEKANSTYLSMEDECTERIQKLQQDSVENPENTAQNDRRIEKIISDQRRIAYNGALWLTGTRLITGMAVSHPEMFRTEEDRNLLNKFAMHQFSNNSINELYRSKKLDMGGPELGLKHPRMLWDGVYKKLQEMTGCNSYQEMMNRGAIRGADGQPLPKDSLFMYYVKLCGGIKAGKIFLFEEKVNGQTKLVPFRWNGFVDSFQRVLNTEAYADQLADIERQIKKAKLPGDRIHFEEDVKATVEAIQDEEEVNIIIGAPDTWILEHRLSHLVDSTGQMRVGIAERIRAGKLTDKDLQQVKLMNRVSNLLYASRLGEVNPTENYRMKLAEKICSERAIELSKSKDAANVKMGLRHLLVPAAHYGFLKKVMDSQAMTDLIGNKSAEELEELLKRENIAVLKEFTTLHGGSLMPQEDEKYETLPNELKEPPKTIGEARLQAGQLLNEITVARKNGEAYKNMLSSAKDLYSQTLAWSKEASDTELKPEEYRLFGDKLQAICQAMTQYAATNDSSDLSILREGAVILNNKIELSLEGNRNVAPAELQNDEKEAVPNEEKAINPEEKQVEAQVAEVKEPEVQVAEAKEPEAQGAVRNEQEAQPRPRRHLPYTEFTDLPKIRKVTKEELLENVEEDVNVLNTAIRVPDADQSDVVEMRRELKTNQITAKGMTNRINDPKNMERYERAYNIFNEKILAPDYYVHQLMEKYPDEDPKKPGELKQGDFGYDKKGGYTRLATTLVQMNESSEVNNSEMHYNPNNHRNLGKAMRRVVETLMNSNMGDVFTMDAERFLDFCENTDLIKFFNLHEIDGALGQQSVFQNPVTHFLLEGKNPNSPLMTTFKATDENPDGLTDEQIDFVMENSEMFCRMSAAAARIVQYATPFANTLPDEPALRALVAHGTLAEDAEIPEKSIFDSFSASSYYYGGGRAPQSFGNYERYFYSVTKRHEKDYNFVRTLKDHPEIEENGWLNADFSASMTGDSGEPTPLTKEQAILQYAKDPNSVKFELNSFGLKKQPERQKERSMCKGVLKSVEGMENILKDIYGSKWNASPEFNKLVEDLNDLKKHAEVESKRFAPNLHQLSRDFKRVQEQAKTYYDAKVTELKGKQPNKLRALRMKFAQKIASLHEPLYKENKLKDTEDKIRNAQKELRTLMNDMESAKPKVAAPREEMLNIVARMVALQTISTTLKNGLAEMDFAAVDHLTSEEYQNLAVETMKNSDAMRTVRNDITNLSKEELLDKMQDVACSKNMNLSAKGGFLSLYNQVIKVVKDKVVADRAEEQRKAEEVRRAAVNQAAQKKENAKEEPVKQEGQKAEHAEQKKEEAKKEEQKQEEEKKEEQKKLENPGTAMRK